MKMYPNFKDIPIWKILIPDSVYIHDMNSNKIIGTGTPILGSTPFALNCQFHSLPNLTESDIISLMELAPTVESQEDGSYKLLNCILCPKKDFIKNISKTDAILPKNYVPFY